MLAKIESEVTKHAYDVMMCASLVEFIGETADSADHSPTAGLRWLGERLTEAAGKLLEEGRKLDG